MTVLILIAVAGLAWLVGVTNLLLMLLVVGGVVGIGLGGLYFFPQFRTRWVTAPLMRAIRHRMPPISATERAAIDAGSVWWDAELFSGRPNWAVIFEVATPQLSEAERDFLAGPVQALCRMTDDWEITRTSELPPAIWQYLKRHKFFGLNAARAYGGLEFSAFAQSAILQTIATRSSSVAVTVMVPNSLGPAELLYHYGTEQQKRDYLPRLANGDDLPCFGLTNPWAGSDADSMPDYGVVCEGEHNGRVQLGFRLNWQKRYITLSPVATLLGLAFHATDPQHLLGATEQLGITCVLIPTDTAGVTIGARHKPLNAAFHNGPNQGVEVFVPLDWVIGGADNIGNGWRMLMESLAAGRGISLPAASAGAAKLALRTSSAYSKIREQFGLTIGRFEGIEESLARIAGLTYLLDSGRILLTTALQQGEKPAVLSAIVKQQCTELARVVINDAMDLHAGKGICLGPANYLANAYQQLPIGITVEGANILTRSLIIFGQGAMRCHPYLLDEIAALAEADEDAALAAFDAIIVRHSMHTLGNVARAIGFGLTRGGLARGTGSGLIRQHSRSIDYLSAAFAVLADVTLYLLGGEMKRREMLSGRFADALSHLYLASAALKRYHDNGADAAEGPLADWACRYALHQTQQAMDGILRNYPQPWLARLMRVVIFPSGCYFTPPSDATSSAVARVVQTPGAVRDRLTEYMFQPDDPEQIIHQVETAYELMCQTEPLRKTVREAKQPRRIGESYRAYLARLCEQNVVTSADAALLQTTRDAVEQVIAVDSFDEVTRD